MRETYRIPDGNRKPLRERIERLNKRAEKLGVSGITMTETFLETERFLVNVHDSSRRLPYPEGQDAKDWNFALASGEWVERSRDWYEITIEGEAPRFEGWIFAGTLLQEEEGVLLRTVPGIEDLPLRFRDEDAAKDCDHCNRSIYRKRTHIVHNEDSGEWMRVGSSCIKDFLGHKDPHHIARWAELLGAFKAELGGIGSDGWGGGYHEDRFPLDGFLSWVQAVSRRIGWVSRTRAYDEGGRATVDKVLNLLTPPRPQAKKAERENWKAEREKFNPEDQDREFAEAAIEWAEQEWLAREDEDLNDYEHNMSVALRSDSVSRKTAGIVASLSAAYYRHLNQERKKAERAKAEPVPETDERIEIEGVIVKRSVKSNAYGDREVMIVRTDQGWAVWGTCPSALFEADVGARVRFVAKVDRSDDPTFGFFKRPSKAEMVEEVEA